MREFKFTFLPPRRAKIDTEKLVLPGIIFNMKEACGIKGCGFFIGWWDFNVGFMFSWRVG